MVHALVRATNSSEPDHPAEPELNPLYSEMGAFDEEMARDGG